MRPRVQVRVGGRVRGACSGRWLVDHSLDRNKCFSDASAHFSSFVKLVPGILQCGSSRHLLTTKGSLHFCAASFRDNCLTIACHLLFKTLSKTYFKYSPKQSFRHASYKNCDAQIQNHHQQSKNVVRNLYTNTSQIRRISHQSIENVYFKALMASGR